MELDLSTFLLEIVNFLILVWLLKRFFYKPVLAVIARRREEIQKQIAAAESIRGESESLKADYENRLARWEEEKEAARRELHGELEAERQRLHEELAGSLEQERERERVLAQRRLQNEAREAERRAVEQATAFLARLLQRLAGPELEARLLQVVVEDLGDFSDEQKAALQTAHAGAGTPLLVTSVWPLPDAGRKALEQALADILGEPPRCEYRQDAALIAGLSLYVGPWLLQANLQEELKYFAQAGNEQ